MVSGIVTRWEPLVVSASLRRRMVTMAAAAGALTVLPAAGQTAVEISGEVSCRQCRITMDTVLTLGGLDGPGSRLVGEYSRVVVDQRGRILLIKFGLPYIAVFDSTGAFLREIGGRGEGPGEYANISHINVGPKYIHVFDLSRGRTVLDTDHAFVRLDRFRVTFNTSAVMPSETVVFAGNLPTSESAGHHLHLLHDNGDLRSYGGDGSVYRGPNYNRQFVVASNASSTWVVDNTSGWVEEWALIPEPQVSRLFIRSVEEFDRESVPYPEHVFPGAYNLDARLDDSGLWIVWQAPDSRWTKRTTDPEVANRWSKESTPQEIHDGVLDLIDPKTGRTLVRYRSDIQLRRFVYGSDMVMAYEETEAGVPWLHILRPRLERQAQSAFPRPQRSGRVLEPSPRGRTPRPDRDR